MALSKQVMFNRVARHLVQQGEMAMSRNGSCAYLASDGSGKRCAIGIFIPDGHEVQHTNMGVTELVVEYPDLKKIIGDDVGFLESLQVLHDNVENWEDMPRAIANFAEGWNLTNPLKEQR